MIYDITHVTTYSYEAPVAAARCALRLLPRDDAGQRVVFGRIDITPAPHDWRERVDFYGNRVAEAQLDAPHVKLGIAMSARVRVERAAPPAEALTPPWEVVRRQALETPSLGPTRRRISFFRAGSRRSTSQRRPMRARAFRPAGRCWPARSS